MLGVLLCAHNPTFFPATFSTCRETETRFLACDGGQCPEFQSQLYHHFPVSLLSGVPKYLDA